MNRSETISTPTLEQNANNASLWSVVPSWPYNYSFIFLNLSSANIMAGTTLILLMRLWNATGAEIGLMLSLIPAAQIVQLFVAPYIERVGVSRFVFAGLTARNALHLALCVLPFWAATGGRYETLKWLFVALIFFFNIAQSVGFAGWVPWMSWLVKESHRGRYFSVEQLMNTAGQFFVSVLCGLMLGKTPENWRFGALFVLAAAMGWASLYSLHRIPKQPRACYSAEKDPFWARLWPLLLIRPFRRLLYLMVCTTMMIVLGQFGVLFMTERLQIDQNIIYYLGSIGIVGGAASAYGWGALADRIGSKPVMQMGQALMLAGSLYWLALSLGAPMSHLAAIAAVGVITMAGMMAYVVTSFRLVCGVLPPSEMVFGAILFNLSVQMSAAAGPAVWGKLLDLFKDLIITISSVQITNYTLLYAMMTLWVILANWFAFRLEEKKHFTT